MQPSHNCSGRDVIRGMERSGKWPGNSKTDRWKEIKANNERKKMKRSNKRG
jgi:hypothetical protein